MDNLLTPFHDWLVEQRRWLHQHPELSYQEYQTAARIAEVAESLGLSVQTGVGKTGVIGRLRARRAGPTVALRADMDALPLDEANAVPYKSRHAGVMHACGHDAHMTIALGVARRLVESRWPEQGRGEVLFVFQPAEEGGAGARAVLEAGAFDPTSVAAIFAGHLQPELALGHIGLVRGVSNAASDSIRIHITGTGGHAAHPHLCADPIVAGAHLVTQLQTIVSRSLAPTEPAVVSIGRFRAGSASNIIAPHAVLEGTLRTLSAETRETAMARLQELAAGLETAFKVTVKLEVNSGYPMLVNHAELVEFTLVEAKSLLGADRVHLQGPRMGAEDFAYFLEKIPGVMVRLGCADPETGLQHGLHSPHFDFDEKALDAGVMLFAHLLTKCLAAKIGECE
jgi:amidohydrolase